MNGIDYKIIGKGEINIIFLNGSGVPYESWNKIYPKFSSHNNVFLYNRRGVGVSSRATVEQDGNTVIKEMLSLFVNLDMSLPNLLVAHSWGGIYANLYARNYSDNVDGIVFVDTPHPSFIAIEKTYKMKMPLALRAIIEGVKVVDKLFDKFKYSEEECIDKTVQQIERAESFPNIPIAVISGMKKMFFVPQRAFDDYQEYQLELLKLSPRVKHYQCKKSSHFPQITEPKMVIAAIQDILMDIKSVNKAL